MLEDGDNFSFISPTLEFKRDFLSHDASTFNVRYPPAAVEEISKGFRIALDLAEGADGNKNEPEGTIARAWVSLSAFFAIRFH